jgi:hypothetical protein
MGSNHIRASQLMSCLSLPPTPRSSQLFHLFRRPPLALLTSLPVPTTSPSISSLLRHSFRLWTHLLSILSFLPVFFTHPNLDTPRCGRSIHSWNHIHSGHAGLDRGGQIQPALLDSWHLLLHRFPLAHISASDVAVYRSPRQNPSLPRSRSVDKNG